MGLSRQPASDPDRTAADMRPPTRPFGENIDTARLEADEGTDVRTPIGARHNACVSCANRALIQAAGDDAFGAIVQAQGSVRLDLYHEPAPDLVLRRPRADFYASRLPDPEDTFSLSKLPTPRSSTTGT